MLRPSDDIYALQASILKTLASARRLEMVQLLSEGPWEVHRLAEHFGTSQPAISQHLAAMRAAGIVESIRDGREVRYQLVDPELVGACTLMRRVLVRRIARLGDLAASFTASEAALVSPIEAH
ncbi:MAG: ArsR/SmtB family transcription factor [Candidatus Limnocylindrales bacterium]